uniref:ASD2 domain-containing protein n=1 Tax=Strongyloides venezuelensis TaxID=75913 RepID=A0A0K0FR47_STRVS
MHNTSFQSYDDYLNSENYKRLCASENRKVSEKLLKSYCQSRYNASDNCQTSKSYILKKETLSSHNKSTFPISPNYLPGDSSNNTTFLTKPSKVTTFPIVKNSNLSTNNSNTITTSHSYFENNLSTTSFNNSLSLNNNSLFLTTKKSDINKLEEENNHIIKPVIQTQINMLHRSPSGAARRIRQRREENSQRQFPILSSPNSASFNNNRSSSSEPSAGTVPSRETMIEGDNDYPKNETLQMDYRDLMNSSSYKSILPDDDFNISYSRPPQRILCNSSSFTSSNGSKIEGGNSEDSQNPEIPHTTSSPPKFQEVNQNIITMESNKFLGKIDFSSLLSTTNTTTMNDDSNQHKIVIPPIPPKRTSIASSGENSICEPSPKTTGNVNNNIANDHKPIIEVHPMPTPRKNHTYCEDSSLNVEKSNEKRIPPPLPKKPSKFVFKTDLNSPIIFKSSEPYFSHIESQQSTSIPPSPAPRAGNQYKEKPLVRQRFDSLPSLSVSNTPQGNNKENEKNNESNVKESTYNNLFIKNQNGACSSLSVSTSNLFSNSFISNSSNISSAQSTESLNQLFTSPSMLSLQNAYRNYPMMTEQDLEILEEKRKNLVESLSRKMRVLEEEKVMIDEDIVENEEFKKRFLQKLDLDPQMLMRLNNHISQAKTLSLLETKINIQLEKLDNYLANDNNDMDPGTLEFCQSRRNRLNEQLSDSSMLRNLHRSRDVEIENVLLSKYFIQPEQMEEWRIYKDSLVRLLTEKRQMEDRLNQAKHQLSILDTLGLQANALMKTLGTPNTHTRETSSGASSMISSSENSRANTLDSGEIVVGDLRTGNSINNGTSNASTALTV